MFTRPVSQHKSVYSFVGSIMRAPSPFFAPPVPVGTAEPGRTNFVTIVTAQGPHTLEKPGLGGGITVGPNNYRQSPVAPLTRKGG